MPPEPTILAFDTSAAHCAAALLVGGHIVARRYEEMTRGQAERLFPILEDVLEEVGTSWSELSAIGVGVGPGNFTGIRIAVSAARGLSLSLGIPAIGVTTFDAVLRERGFHSGTTEIRLTAPRDAAYVQIFTGGVAVDVARLETAPDSARGIAAPDWSGGTLESLAGIAAARLSGGSEMPRPTPLYIRPADAAPPREAPPVILP